MTTIHYHPSTDLLLSYSAGVTTLAQSLCVAAHLEFCSACRTHHQRNNAIGGVLMTHTGKSPADRTTSSDAAYSGLASVNDAVKSAVLNRLDDTPSSTNNQQPGTSATTLGDVPRPLQRLIPHGFGELSWRRISTSAKNFFLFKDEQGTQVGLLKLNPGGRVGKHDHLGDEYTVVLSGSFSDEDGVYGPGDFLLRSPKQAHTPMATLDGECICLTAQEAPLQFSGWLLRLLNPFLRKQYQQA